MALVILDGNQSATTLSTIVVSSAHIPAHTVVSLGAQAISDIASSVSGSVVSISNFPASQTTTFGAVTGSVSVLNFPASQAVTFSAISVSNFPATQLVSLATLPALVESTAQIGSVTASISGTIPISISSVTIGNSITISSLPALVAGTAQIGSVTASISGTIPVSIASVTIGNAISISNFPASQSTTFGAVTGSISVLNFPATQAISISSVTIGNSITISSVPPISGSVTLGAGDQQIGSVTASISGTIPISISSVTIGNFPATQLVSLNTLPALVAGTAQIGSVTANLGLIESVVATEGLTASGTFVKIGGHTGTSTTGNIAHVSAVGAIRVDGSAYTQPISIASVTIGNFPATQAVSIASVTIGSLPALVAGTAQIGSVTASLAISSTAITSGSFSSLTSATLVPENPARKMATVYNLGAGQLFVNAGVTATTLGGGFMVALSSGDFYECNYTTTTLSAIFANAGTASWVSY